MEFLHKIIDFLAAWYIWIAIGSAVMFVGGILMIPVLVVQIPQDYFLKEHELEVRRLHPVLHFLMLIARNLLGIVLIILGIILSVPAVPGQGILTILVGLMVTTIPGKRKFICKIVSIPQVYHGLNRLRARYGHPPLILPSQSAAGDPSEESPDGRNEQ